MRTWSFEEDGYYKAMILVDGQTTGWVKKEDAQFIVDACNAAEAAQEQPERGYVIVNRDGRFVRTAYPRPGEAVILKPDEELAQERPAIEHVDPNKVRYEAAANGITYVEVLD